jgi:hypothetical protein
MEDVAAMFLRLDAEENGIAPQPVAPAKKAKAEVPSAFQHSFDRAIERYGILVRPQELVRVIEEGSALLVGPGFGDITIYNVPVKAGDEIVFVKVTATREAGLSRSFRQSQVIGGTGKRLTTAMRKRRKVLREISGESMSTTIL